MEVSADDHQVVLKETIQEWIKQENDVQFVSKEGDRIYSHKILLSLYSSHLQQVFSEPSFVFSLAPVTIFLPSSSSASISLLMNILLRGKSATNQRSELEHVKEIAKALGINLSKCFIEDGNSSSNPSVLRRPQVPIENPENKTKMERIDDKTVDDSTNLGTHPLKQTLSEDASSTAHKVVKPGKKCDVCEAVYETRTTLVYHRRKKHGLFLRKESDGNPKRTLKCDTCGNLFTSRRYLIAHRLKQHGIKTNKGEKFDGETSEMKNKCGICSKTFSTISKLRQHQFAHLQDSEKPSTNLNILANLSVKKFHNVKYSNARVKNENNVNHSDLINAKLIPNYDDNCGYCGAMFSNNDDLNHHIALTHDNSPN